MRFRLTGRQVVCSLLCLQFTCVCSHPVQEDVSDLDAIRIKQGDLVSQASSHVLRETSCPESSEDIASELEDLRDDVGKDIIPIRSHTTTKNDIVLLPLTLEPDAEMLPVNYKGVKPPGVDHMELVSLEPQGMASDLKVSRSSGTEEVYRKSGGHEQGKKYQEATLKHDKQSADNEKGSIKGANFEKGVKGSKYKETEKGKYSEKGGKKKSRFEEDNDEGFHSDDGGRLADSYYHSEGGNDDNRKSKGFREKYHKDEYKKDADFYNNGHKGGSFIKHGRYDEKHTSDERGYKEGEGHNAEQENVQDKKEKGNYENGYSNKDAKGYKAEEGYDSFFNRNEEYGKKKVAADGKEFGYKRTHSEKSR